MKKLIVLSIITFIIISTVFIQFSLANTAFSNNSDTMYVYETDLITKETTKREINVNNLQKNRSSNVSMEPYIPENILEVVDENPNPNTKAIVGNDDRTLVNTDYFPYSCIGYLSINNGEERGTAFLVDDNIAITAAHCVVGKDYIQFYPGSTLNSHPYGEAWVTRYIWAGGDDYTHDTDFEDDWAILVLDTDVGNNAGWFGVSNMAEYPNGPSGWVGLLAEVSGYPADKGWDQWHATGNILTASDKLLTINTDIKGGHSGSPTYKYNGGHYAYGIATGEHNSSNPYNFVTRFYDRVYNAIMDAKVTY